MNIDLPLVATPLSKRVRWLACVTTVLALTPLLALLLSGLFELVFPPKGHNPWLSGGSWWGNFLMVLVITAPAHIPYLTILGATAWGLFRQNPWAISIALILSPLAAIFSLFAWAAVVICVYAWLVKGITDSNINFSVLFCGPIAILLTTYCVTAVLVEVERRRCPSCKDNSLSH